MPRLPGRGLRSRIIWTTALVSALAMAAMIGTVVLALHAVTRKDVRSTLEDRLLVIASGIESDSGGPARALQSPVDSINDSTWLWQNCTRSSASVSCRSTKDPEMSVPGPTSAVQAASTTARPSP